MRVCLRKIHFASSICFRKPARHLTNLPPATLNSDRGESAAVGSDHLVGKKEGEGVVVVGDRREKVDETEAGSGVALKSCIKRKVVAEEGRKKNVKWMDVAGKSLVHVEEFETSESEDTDSECEPSKGCICAFL